MRNKSIYVFIMALTLLLGGCSSNSVVEDNSVEDTVEQSEYYYTFERSSSRHLNEQLEKQKYLTTYKENTRYIAIVKVNEKDVSISNTLIKSGENIEISISKDQYLIVSLPQNSTIAYEWSADTIVGESIEYVKNDEINVPLPVNEQGKDGTNYDRNNFLYNVTGKEGPTKLSFTYQHIEETRDDPITFTAVVNIEDK